jgi:putative DNA primase/helicase
MNDEFSRLSKECLRLKEFLKEQKQGTLSEDKWSAVVRLLVDVGRIALARNFEEYAEERRYEQERTIDRFSLQRHEGDIPCLELGCTEENIEDFFKKKCRLNPKGEIINSPAEKLRFADWEKMIIGFHYRKTKEDDDAPLEYSGMNPNIYARFILENNNLMFHESDRYYIYCNHYWKVFPEFKMQKTLRTFFHKFESNRWTTSVQTVYMSALRYECWDTEELQSAERYINVKNGLLDLDTDEITLVPHNKMVFSTTQIPIHYDKGAQCPKFKDFLLVIFRKDKELYRLVQEIMGYCLSSSIKAHKMFIFLGIGSNGKSVLCEIMTALAGGIENVSNVALKDFNHRFSLSQIADKTLNIATENETNTRLDTQMLKAITSGEPIQMEEKFQTPFSYRPYVKLVFAMNELPYVKDKSYGFERRLIVIPFEMRFVDYEPRSKKEAKIDRNLADTIIQEELDGIFAFAIRGLKRLRKNGFVFTKSAKAEKALEKYKETIDPCLTFVREYITEDEKAEKVNMTELREMFQNWCRDEGHSHLEKISAPRFFDEMKRIFSLEGIPFRKQKSNKQYLTGIKVKGLNDKRESDESNEDTFDDSFDL